MVANIVPRDVQNDADRRKRGQTRNRRRCCGFRLCDPALHRRRLFGQDGLLLFRRARRRRWRFMALFGCLLRRRWRLRLRGCRLFRCLRLSRLRLRGRRLSAASGAGASCCAVAVSCAGVGASCCAGAVCSAGAGASGCTVAVSCADAGASCCAGAVCSAASALGASCCAVAASALSHRLGLVERLQDERNHIGAVEIVPKSAGWEEARSLVRTIVDLPANQILTAGRWRHSIRSE